MTDIWKFWFCKMYSASVFMNDRKNEQMIKVDCEIGSSYIWGKIFKNGPSKIYGRQRFKKLKLYGLLKPYPIKIFKGCLPQVLFGPFLNTLCQMLFCQYYTFWKSCILINLP